MSIVVLVGIVSPKHFGSGCYSPRTTARLVMCNHGQAISIYRRVHGALPRTLADLTWPDPGLDEPLLTEIPRDPWGREYRYRVVGTDSYEIRSLGELEHDDADDLVFPEVDGSGRR